MKKLKHYHKCPNCGRNVKNIETNESEYQYECNHCDESFYLFEVLIIK